MPVNIREVKCLFGFQHVLSGKVRQLVFEETEESALVFKSACSLRITLCYSPFEEKYSNADVETDKLYQYIRDMVPNVRELHITTMNYGIGAHSGVEDDPVSGPQFKRLVRQLSEIPTCCKLSVRGAFEDDSMAYDQLQLTTNLTHICLDNIAYSINPHFFQLICSQAQHLKFLKVEDDSRFTDYSVLIFDGNTTYTNYPQLRCQQIDWWLNYPPEQLFHIIPEHVVPFPILQALGCMETYPFGDDTLFRGNYQRSLRRLGLMLNSRLAKIISQNNISFDNLDQAELHVRGVPGVDEGTIPVVVGIARSAKSLVFNAFRKLPIPKTEVITELSQQLQKIQHLELNIKCIPFQGIKILLKSLPRLHTLRVCTVVADELPQSISFTDFICNLDTGPEIWNNNFGHLGFRYAAKLSTPYPAEELLMLAIACPNLSRVTFLNDSPEYTERLKGQFAELLDSKKSISEKYGYLKDTLQIYTKIKK